MNAKLMSILAATGIFFIGVLLIFILWNFILWYSLIIIAPIIIVLEIYLLNKIDSYYIIKKKKKLIQMGVITDEAEISPKDRTISIFDQYKNKVNRAIKKLNDFLIDMDDIYYESLNLIEDGELITAKRRFKSYLSKVNDDIEEEDIKVIKFTNNILADADKKLNLSIINFKENWNKEKNSIVKKIKEIAEKFKIRSEIMTQIEQIFQFEIENSRGIEEADLKSLNIPDDQYKRIINIIEKPIKIDVKNLNEKERQKLGEVSKNVISICMKNDITPNLAYLYHVLKIDLRTAKEILSYLKNIGMIDVIFYHAVE
jgi:hypothetical protein